MNNSKQVLVSILGVLAGGALLYYLSREDKVKLDSNVHTRERFLALLEELNLEYVCIYVRNYNMLLKYKENGEWTQQIQESAAAEAEVDIGKKTTQVLKQNPGFTIELVSQFLKENAKDSIIKGYASKIEKLRDDVFKKMLITDLCFKKDLPAKMTKEIYIQIYRKIFATLRHDMYMRIQETKKEKGTMNLSPDEFEKIFGETWGRFENIREDIYNLIMDENVQSKEAKKVMQRAYVTYASIATQATDGKGNTIRSRWADQVTDVAHKHEKYMNDMSQGNFYPNIEIDPRDSKDADEKVSLGNLPNLNLKRRKTMLSDAKTHVTKMSPAAEKYVRKMKEIATQIHKEVEEKKSLIQATQEAEVVEEVPTEELAVPEHPAEQPLLEAAVEQ